MEQSVYLVAITLSFFVRASSEGLATRIAADLMTSRGADLENHATKLDIVNMEVSPDGILRMPFVGEVDAEE